MSHRWWAWGLCLGLGCSLAVSEEVREYDWGPLLSQRVAPDGTARLRALGPLFESTETPSGETLWALRPFFSREDHSATDRRTNKVEDGLWPLWTRKWLGSERQWSAAVFWRGIDWDVTDPASRSYTWLFPFWFSGTDALGQSYKALFPFYGSIHEFGGRDEIDFTLFPLRVRTRTEELTSSKWLWPVFSHTRGPGVDRWRIFPFYGRATRLGVSERRFYLWPFVHTGKSLMPTKPGSGWMVFPLAGNMRFAGEETTYVFPPFFRWSRGGATEVTHAPWPFYQRSTGAVDKRYFFPLYGTKKMDGVKSGFVLWPIVRWKTVQRAGELIKDAGVYPVWIQQDRYAVEGEPAQAKSRQLWPLFRYERDGDYTRFRTLALWPAKTHRPIERNWSPLWTLFETERDGANRRTEALWGLFRREREESGKRHTSVFPLIEWGRGEEGAKEDQGHWSLLKGALGRTRTEHGARWKVLYLIEWGGRPRKSDNADASEAEIP